MVRVIRYPTAGPIATKNSVVMTRHEIDRTDLKLLTALQNDGRLTNVELSKYAGLSPPPCLRRVRTLEESGIIRGYHADIDPKKLGFQLTALVFVGLTSQASSEINAFNQLVNGWVTVREAYALQGEVDFVLKCVTRDLTEFQSFITEVLLKVSSVRTVKTSLVFDTVVRKAGIPLLP